MKVTLGILCIVLAAELAGKAEAQCESIMRADCGSAFSESLSGNGPIFLVDDRTGRSPEPTPEDTPRCVPDPCSHARSPLVHSRNVRLPVCEPSPPQFSLRSFAGGCSQALGPSSYARPVIRRASARSCASMARASMSRSRRVESRIFPRLRGFFRRLRGFRGSCGIRGFSQNAANCN